MSDSESEAEVEEDPRIATLYAFAAKRCEDGKYTGDAAEFVAKLNELGTADAIVYGNLTMNRLLVRAHFAVSALVDADDMTVGASVELMRAPLKAVVADGGDGAGEALCAALESFCFNGIDEESAREESVEAFDKALRALWEWEIVPEDDIRAWQANERSAMACLNVSLMDARRIRERGQAFLEWVERGEDD